MKKTFTSRPNFIVCLLLFFIAGNTISFTAKGQASCAALQAQLTTPGQFLPNPLPDGFVNNVYSQNIAYRWKVDTVLFGQTIPYDSVQITGINNLPAGINFTGCTIAGCKYILPTNNIGCLTINGIPTVAYNDSIEIQVNYWFTVFGSAQSVAETVKLPLKIIDSNPSSCAALQAQLTLPGQFLPNPLPNGCVNNLYTQNIAFRLKEDTVLFGFTLNYDSVQITGINNLPAGMVFTGCTIAGCKYILPSNNIGCLTINGIPTVAYNDSIEIQVNYFVTIPFVGVGILPETVKLPLKIFNNCVVVCNISSASLNNIGVCNNNSTPGNAADDFYTADLTVNFINQPAAGTLRIEPGNPNILDVVEVPVASLVGNSHIFTGVRLRTNASSFPVNVQFSTEVACGSTFTAPAISNCSNQTCSALQGQLTRRNQFLPNPLSDGCINNFYSQNIAFRSRKDTVLFGFTLSMDSVRITAINNLPAGINFAGCSAVNCIYVSPDSTGCLTINGTPTTAYEDSIEIQVDYFVTVPFVGVQIVTEIVKLPLKITSECASPCGIIGMTFNNIGSCNNNGTPGNAADDFFNVDVDVLFSNPPATGNLILQGAGVVGSFTVAAGTLSGGSHTFIAVKLLANGNANLITASFTANGNCSGSTTGPAVGSCSAGGPCDLNQGMTFNNNSSCNNNGTPSNPADDFFTSDVQVFFANPPATGNLVLSGAGIATTVSVPVGLLNSATSHTFIAAHLTANGNANIVTATFDANAGACTGSTTGPAIGSCSAVPPVVLTCPVNTTTAACQTQAAVNTAFATWLATASASGGCSGVLTNNNTGAPSACGGSTTVTFTYTSSCAPTTTTCQATFTVTAIPAVVLTCPTNTTTAACQTQAVVNTAFATWLATASASGGCNGVLTNNNTGAPSACGGSTTVTFTYTSSCAPLTTTCTATFTVTAAPPVVLTCPVNTTTAACQTQVAVNTAFATWLATATASGGCNVVLTNNNTGAPSACGGSTTVTFTYTSSCAPLTTTCQATFTVTAPPPVVITCPAAVTVSCAAAVPAPNVGSVIINGGCSVVVTHIGDVISAQTCANRFTITRTYRGTDLCGNFSQCTQIITVNDVTAPVITCPVAVTVSCASAVPAVNIASVTATDNCAGVVTITHISDVISNQTCANRFTVTRTYRATDVCGNFSQCTQIITVNDVTAPVITCPANITVTTPIGSCVAIVNFTPTATDNCGAGVTIVSVPASGTAFPIGTTTVTSTATDACGNSSSCTFTVTVLDGQLPVITSQPANRTVCVGANATFSLTAITSPNAGGPLSYQWQQWNGTAWVNISGATASSFTVNSTTLAMNTNTFRCVVTGLCTIVNSGAATLFVNPLPSISLNASSPPSLLPNQTTTITAAVNPSGGNFVWSLNGNAIAGVTGSVLGPLGVDNIGTYNTVYTDPNGCVITSINIIVSGQAGDILWIYPNPNQGQFQVRYFNQQNEALSLNIYNTAGQRIMQKNFTTTTAYTKIDIDLGNSFSEGVYIVEVINAAGRRVGAKQVIVRHH
jgi:HYR domain/Secretion system C-terminal sorting domain